MQQKTNKKINENKSWFFEKIEKLVARSVKKMRAKFTHYKYHE